MFIFTYVSWRNSFKLMPFFFKFLKTNRYSKNKWFSLVGCFTRNPQIVNFIYFQNDFLKFFWFFNFVISGIYIKNCIFSSKSFITILNFWVISTSMFLNFTVLKSWISKASRKFWNSEILYLQQTNFSQ